MNTPLLRAGSTAPDFVFSPEIGGRWSLDDLCFTPLLLVLSSGPWLCSNAELSREVGAQLRGLGASIALLSPQRTWCFAPDNNYESNTVALTQPQLTELMAAFGYEQSHGTVLYVLDRHRLVRGSVALTPKQTSGTLTTKLPTDGQTTNVVGLIRDALAYAEMALRQRYQQVHSLMTRREWLIVSLLSGVSMMACANPPPSARTAPVSPPDSLATVIEGEVAIHLKLNGSTREVRVEPAVTLLDALRERLALTGTKKGCDHGQCGACTVLIDGQRVNSCLTLALSVGEREVTTIEGLATDDQLHAMQAAFVRHDAFQCGYCTPGQIVSAVALVKENRAMDEHAVAEHMSGNICRCGAYANIVRAIQDARRVM